MLFRSIKLYKNILCRELYIYSGLDFQRDSEFSISPTSFNYTLYSNKYTDGFRHYCFEICTVYVYIILILKYNCSVIGLMQFTSITFFTHSALFGIIQTSEFTQTVVIIFSFFFPFFYGSHRSCITHGLWTT